MAQAKWNKKQVARGPGVAPRLAQLARETLFLVLCALAVYLLIALGTYSPADPGWSHTGAPDRVANLGGSFGAWFADVALHGLGRVAYLLPVLVAFSGWRLLRGRARDTRVIQRRLLGALGLVLLLVGACGLENLHFAATAGGTPFVAGGVLGDLVNRWLTDVFGFVGATVFLLTMMLVGVTWFGRVSWFRVMDATGRYAFAAGERVAGLASSLADRFAGARARRDREGSVQRFRQKLEKEKPPRIEPRIETPPPGERVQRERQPSLFRTAEKVELPALSLLQPAAAHPDGYSNQALEAMSRLLEKKLADFNVDVRVTEVHPGPVITRFEMEPAPGVKASQVVSLSRDLARALSVVSVRVVENIPGKTVIGIEVPNESRETVRLVEGLSSSAYEDVSSPLAVVLGKDISGNPVVADLAKMPHLLIAGTTGSGKSVCINALILSIVYKATPDQVRFILVDPKMLELSVYDGIPHLLAPVVTDMKEAANALRWCIVEMERRYKIMAALGVRNIAGYNRRVKQARDAGESLMDPLTQDAEEPRELEPLPYVVVVIDELADLMMVVGKKVEELITRIAQRARAAGIHLVLATQRPSVDVITGLIKANIPARIAFQVSSRVDSRTILDNIGAEQLLGRGDMLFLQPGSATTERVHGSFVDDQEVHQVVESLKEAGPPLYEEEVLSGGDIAGDAFGAGTGGEGGESDPLYDQALRVVTETRRASISAVQRQLRVGYNRAARMIEAMEQAGVVGPLEPNGKREVLAPPPPQQ